MVISKESRCTAKSGNEECFADPPGLQVRDQAPSEEDRPVYWSAHATGDGSTKRTELVLSSEPTEMYGKSVLNTHFEQQFVEVWRTSIPEILCMPEGEVQLDPTLSHTLLSSAKDIWTRLKERAPVVRDYAELIRGSTTMRLELDVWATPVSKKGRNHASTLSADDASSTATHTMHAGVKWDRYTKNGRTKCKRLPLISIPCMLIDKSSSTVSAGSIRPASEGSRLLVPAGELDEGSLIDIAEFEKFFEAALERAAAKRIKCRP